MAEFKKWYDYEPEAKSDTSDKDENIEVDDYEEDDMIDIDQQTITTRITVDSKTKPLSLGDVEEITQKLEKVQKVEKFEQVFTSTELPIKEEEITYSHPLPLEKAEQRYQKEMQIGNNMVAVENLVIEATKELKDTSDKSERIREYNKVAEMPKVTYTKANEGSNSMKKLLFFITACIILGIIFGVKANSYYIYTGKSNGEDSISCAFSWLFEENLPTDMSPVYAEVFGTAFLMGAGILGVIGLLIYLDNDAKKASRVGHEHGMAHLAKLADHKTYTSRFMESIAPVKTKPSKQKVNKVKKEKSTEVDKPQELKPLQ